MKDRPSGAAPRVGTITVTFNSAGFIAETLASITALRAGQSVVVDNGSTDDTADIVETTKGITAHRGTNIGFGAGCNLGVSLITRPVEFYLFLNPDAQITPADLTTLVDYLDAHPEVGIVGPRMFRDGEEIPSCGDDASLLTEVHPLLLGPLRRLTPTRVTPPGSWQTGPVGYVEGACFLVRRELFEQVGGFDERFFLFFEELDLGHRFRARGSAVHVVGDASASHLRAASRATVSDGARSHFWASTWRYLEKWHGRRTADLWARVARTMWLIRRIVGSIDKPTHSLWLGELGKAQHHRPASTGKRVLVAHPSPDLYGSDRSLLRSIDALAADGWQVEVTMPLRGPLCDEIDKRRLRLHIVRVPVLARRWLKPWGLLLLPFAAVLTLSSQLALLRRTKPDVVYVNTITLPTWAIAARLTGRPAVVHCREAEDHAPAVLQRLLLLALRPASTVITNSKATAAWVSQSKSLASRTHVVYNCAQAPYPPKPAAGKAPLRFVLVGRLNHRKGQDVAIGAIELLAAAGVPAHLTIVGDVYPGYEPWRDELVARVRDQALGDRVEFAGFRSDPWPSYRDADCVLVPSRVEPFGLVAIEGMLSERAVIVSAVQGLAEIVQDGESGLLVTPGHPQALAHAMTRLVQDKQLRQRLAKDGRARAESEFSVERYGKELTAVFAKLVA